VLHLKNESLVPECIIIIALCSSGGGSQDASSGDPSSSGTNKHSDLDDLEPKLRNAIIKMRKLDVILSKRVKKEKAVKRDRIMLERR